MAPGRSHVYLSSNLWDGLWIIQQPTANEIAGDEEVLYVERFVSVFTVLRYPSLWRRLFTWMRGPRRKSANLRLLAPLPLFHLGHRFPWLFRLEFALQRLWIRSWLKSATSTERILWLDNPLYECAVGTMGESLAVYHVADDITAFATSDPVISERLESKTLQKVDLVFAASEELARDKRGRQPKSYTVWNAIDVSAFANATNTDVPEVAAVPEPRVAFIGTLDEWVDIQLLAAATRRLPTVHFVIVGPAKTDISVLAEGRNVHILGLRPRSLVPSILKLCSASLVPFRRTRLTERVVPLKVFEALAAGVRPICTDFSPDLRELADQGYVRVAANLDEFVAAIESAIRENTVAERKRLTNFGLRQSWHDRWQQMKAVLGGAEKPTPLTK